MTQEWSGNLSKNQLMERIGHYVCNECGSGHSSDNMVPVCASCHHAVKMESDSLLADCDALKKKVEELEKVRDALNKHNDKLNDALQTEHECYLYAHRERMKCATRSMEKDKLIKKMKAALKSHACPDDGWPSADTRCYPNNHKCAARRLSK